MQAAYKSSFSFVEEHCLSEYLALKDLLRSEDPGLNFFIMDDAACLRDITALPDTEIVARLNSTFENQVDLTHLNMPLIALIDYLF